MAYLRMHYPPSPAVAGVFERALRVAIDAHYRLAQVSLPPSLPLSLSSSLSPSLSLSLSLSLSFSLYNPPHKHKHKHTQSVRSDPSSRSLPVPIPCELRPLTRTAGPDRLTDWDGGPGTLTRIDLRGGRVGAAGPVDGRGAHGDAALGGRLPARRPGARGE